MTTLRARQRVWCQVPCCSRTAARLYHVLAEAGGREDRDDHAKVCAPHFRALRNGQVRVRGRGPDHLLWELGVRPDQPPFMVYERPRVEEDLASLAARLSGRSAT